jgi:predicted nucleic acid-binding Zn ribbon protein
VKKSEERPINQVIEEFLDVFRLRNKMNEAKVIASWPKVVGELVAKNTIRLSIQKKILYIKIDIAPLRNELLYARSKIISALNKEVGSNVVEELVFF